MEQRLPTHDRHGFSKKPVMEGTGTAAGEAYAWAIENPDKVACIVGRNPALRSLMSKTSPLENLAPSPKPACRCSSVRQDRPVVQRTHRCG